MTKQVAQIALILALATPTLGYGQNPADLQPVTITISLKEVRLLLPVGQRDLWQWRLPETPESQREYGWEVVLDGPQARGFGFYLFKFPGSAIGSGNLPQLLRAGQSNVWERTAQHLERMVPQARISLVPADSGVVITIRDSWTIAFLFGSRPSGGLLRLQNPGRDLKQIPVRFEYTPD